MDYEKAYKESFEAAKGLHDAGNALTKKQMEIVFPQLAESEDERIRKSLLAYIKGESKRLDTQKWISYLEKQKEQKPTEINFKALLTADRLASAEMTGRLKERSEILENPEKYGLQKPAEWGEEDEQWLESIIREYEKRLSVDKDHAAVIQIKIDFLKSLRPQPHWKPNEEQPESFDTAAFQKGVQEGRRLEREDVKSTIQSRIDEILGDAQPKPALRMELQELIKKIEA